MRFSAADGGQDADILFSGKGFHFSEHKIILFAKKRFIFILTLIRIIFILSIKTKLLNGSLTYREPE
jgi:hypothetical protein